VDGLDVVQEMKAIAITVAALLGIAALLIIGLHLWMYIGLWLHGRALRRRLSRSGRTLTIEEAKSLLEQGEGSIVIDAPTLGWNVSRVWWAPSGLIVPRPEHWEGDRTCPPEDDLNFRRLIDYETGIAKLISPFLITQRTQGFLKRYFGLDSCGFIFSGGVEFERSLKLRQEAQQAGTSNGG
jgi:hypothetical protein